MRLAVLATVLLSAVTPPAQRTERLVALARLDATVRYFDPRIATAPSSWDSLFAANAVRIADASTSAEYARLIAAMMNDLHDAGPSTAPQRALVYEGFPSPTMQSSGGYAIRWRNAGAGETYRVEMGEHAHVDVRLSEPSADTTATVRPLAVPNSARWGASYPSAGYRILGAARLWSTIRLFYPYKALMGGNWDDQLRAALPAVEGARDSVEYAKAIAAFSSHINDTHVNVISASLLSVTGAVPVGALARLIENRLVITRIVDSAAARAGLRVGDIVLSVDGEAVDQRIARIQPFLAAGTPAAMRARLETQLLVGATMMPAQLVVRGDAGDRMVTVPRSGAFYQQMQHHRTGSIIRILPGNVGYVDLDRLPVTMVDSAFRTLAGTKAIVFDNRGYPLGTAWAIGTRLNVHPGVTTAASFRRLIVRSPDTARTTTFQFDQPIPLDDHVPKYTGKTVMLIDERTISQAEHTGLFFEAANGTTFIGSQTMGANGDITMFTIPGNISITFTGHDVRHADGRQLQRVGLEPQVTVTPTIAGIRAGRDEVLEAALKYVGGTGEVLPDTAHELPPDRSHGADPIALERAAKVIGRGWTASASGTGYRAGIDQTIAHGGASSLRLSSQSAAPDSFAILNQAIKADNYLGRRVRFSAYVKTRGVSGRGAGLWMRVDGNGGTLAFDNMQTRPITGTTEWTLCSVVLDVPKDADGMAFGVLLVANGEVWVDDASLEIVGDDVHVTNTMRPAPNSMYAEQMRAAYARAWLTPLNLGFEPER